MAAETKKRWWLYPTTGAPFSIEANRMVCEWAGSETGRLFFYNRTKPVAMFLLSSLAGWAEEDANSA